MRAAQAIVSDPARRIDVGEGTSWNCSRVESLLTHEELGTGDETYRATWALFNFSNAF